MISIVEVNSGYIQRFSVLLCHKAKTLSEGRQFRVGIIYEPLKDRQFIVDAAEKVVYRILKKGRGSVLVFIFGISESKQLDIRLTQQLASDPFISEEIIIASL